MSEQKPMKLYLVRHSEYGKTTVNGRTKYDAVIAAAKNGARGESFEGQVAVIEVVLNRMLSDYFPDTVEEVVFQKHSDVWQFSPAPCLYSTEPGKEQYLAVHTAIDEREYIFSEDTVYFQPRLITKASIRLSAITISAKHFERRNSRTIIRSFIIAFFRQYAASKGGRIHA